MKIGPIDPIDNRPKGDALNIEKTAAEHIARRASMLGGLNKIIAIFI